MAENRQIREFDEIIHGTTASSSVKMTDLILLQHEDVSGNVNTFNRFTVGQTMCQPVAVTPNSTPSNGAYTATCSNFPDFAISYTDKNSNTHSLIGMKVRVIFTTGITYGSTTANPPTYPTLNINGTGALPLLAQGMTMGAGSASSGQSLELTLIPYGNSLAWDADTNVREKSSTETVYVDGTKRINTVTSGSTDMVTSGAVDNAIKDGDKVLIYSGDKQTDTFDIDNLPTDGVRVYKERNNSSVGWDGQDGIIVSIPWQGNLYQSQLAIDDESNFIAIRSKKNGTWQPWNPLKTYKKKEVLLSSACWVKVCMIARKNTGAVVEFDITSQYYHTKSMSHHIIVNYGFCNATVSDFCIDSNRLFDKIRVCWVNNSTNIAILVHYNVSDENQIQFNVSNYLTMDKGITTAYEVIDPTTYSDYVEYALGDSSLYINGHSVAIQS